MTNNLDLAQVAPSQSNKETTINDQAGQLDAALTAKLALTIDSTNARNLTNITPSCGGTSSLTSIRTAAMRRMPRSR
jgi:hypothetical protein